MRKIWLINHYAMPPELEPRIRTVKFAEFLQQRGYDVTIVGASSMHNMNSNLITDRSPYAIRSYGDIKFIHIRARNYKNMTQRIINLLEFPLRLLWYASHFERPDIIIHTATVPFSNVLCFLARKLKVQYIVEVLDLWPESFRMLGLISERNPLLPMLYWCERWLYVRANRLVFSMEGGKDYLIEKGWDTSSGGAIELDKVLHINNGVDLKEFARLKETYMLDDADLQEHSTFRVVYIGAIRHFNNIKMLIDAAKMLMANKSLKVLIYGDGDQREELETYARVNGISNVIFKQRFVDKKFIPYILSRSSLNIINYDQSDIWRYGESQNKMFQYLASGRPICSNIVPAYSIIQRYQCGIAQKFKDADEYATAIQSLCVMPEQQYEALCSNALIGAAEYDFDVLTKKLVELFE